MCFFTKDDFQRSDKRRGRSKRLRRRWNHRTRLIKAAGTSGSGCVAHAPQPVEVEVTCIFEKCIFEKCIFRKFCKFLAGSFSAVSKRNFARKYAFDSFFQALQDLHPLAPLQSQNFRKKSIWKNSNFREISARKLQMSQNLQILSNFINFSLRIW